MRGDAHAQGGGRCYPERVIAALPLFGSFVLGLVTRRWLQRRVALLFRVQLAGGVGVLAVLAGWSFQVSVRNVTAVAVLLGAQLAAVLLASYAFRAREGGPLAAFAMYGNPGFWSLPVATATLGAEAAVFLAAYDMLTQPRIALGVKLMRRRAPLPQSSRTALADYAPTAGAVAGLLLGQLVAPPDELANVVAGLGIAMASVGALLLGVAWPRGALALPDVRSALPALALHLTVVPLLLLAATLAGVALPGVVWFLALGPLPTSLVSFAQVYGYPARVAASALAVSMAVAILLLPVALALAG